MIIYLKLITQSEALFIGSVYLQLPVASFAS